MTMRRMRVTALSAMMLATVSADAQDDSKGIAGAGTIDVGEASAGAGSHWVKVADQNVAGVKLGMTADQARDKLRSLGFTPRGDDSSQDAFAELVRRGAEKRRGEASSPSGAQQTVASKTVVDGSQGERIEVWYASLRTEPVVNQVIYTIPAERMSAEIFAVGIKVKYGKATAGSPRNALFCTAGETACRNYSSPLLPYMEVQIGSATATHRIELSSGQQVTEQRQSELAAAIEAAAPANAKPSF